MEQTDVEGLVRQVIQEFVSQQQAKSEPAHKAELQEEKKRREQLERRVNELVDEADRSRKHDRRRQFVTEPRLAKLTPENESRDHEAEEHHESERRDLEISELQ